MKLGTPFKTREEEKEREKVATPKKRAGGDVTQKGGRGGDRSSKVSKERDEKVAVGETPSQNTRQQTANKNRSGKKVSY